MDIPLLPVVMVLLGGTGILKCLSFLLQLGIVLDVWRKRRDKGAEFMSETSGLDNTMNWTYIIVLLAGARLILTWVTLMLSSKLPPHSTYISSFICKLILFYILLRTLFIFILYEKG